MTRVPDDAFAYYVSLGPDRSYRAVAEKYGLTKRGITRHASANDWPSRLAKIEREARERSDQKLSQALDDIRARHLKTLRAMNARALEALRQYPITDGMDAMKAAEMVIKLERLIIGEPSERTALSVEEVTRQEMRELLVVDDGGDGDDSSGFLAEGDGDGALPS